MTTAKERSAPLADIRVVDLGTGLAARYCAQLLAGAGAYVVRAAGELVSGDDPILDHYLERGKRLVHGATQTEISELIQRADVLVYDSASLDLAHSAIRKNSGLISVRITPFGEEGLKSDWKGDDLVAVCAGGLAHATPGIPDFSNDLEREPPLRADALVGELVSGVQAASAVLMSVLGRDKTGQGSRIDISMQEVVAAIVPWDVNLWTYGNAVVGRREVRAHLAPNVYLQGKNGRVVLVAFSEVQWQSLVELMGSPDWADSELFQDGALRGEHSEALHVLLQDWLQTKDHWALLRELQARSIPSAPVLDLVDAISNDHAQERRFIEKVSIPGVGDALLPGNVYVVDGERRSQEGASEATSAAVLDDWRSGRNAEADEMISSSLPLCGVRVLDFSQFVAMPLAGEWLALMGAEVLLVESRGNLASRRWAPFAGEPEPDTCGLFNNINKGKKSVTLNLKEPRGRELARQLAATCDLVIENFSPGTMGRLEVGYDDLRKLNPRLSMVSLSAFGSTGPWRDFVSFHSGVAALSGFAEVTGYEQSYPRIMGAVAPDTIAAAYCFLGALRALRAARLTGEGQHVELAMSEILQSLMPQAIAQSGSRKQYERIGNRHPQKSPHNVYRCRGDDAWVAVSVSTAIEWRTLATIVQLGELEPEDAYSSSDARKERETDVDEAIARWASDKTPDEAAEILQAASVPSSKVFNARDLIEDDHLRARGFIVEVDHPKAGARPYIGVPWRIVDSPAPVYRHAPMVGDATDYALSEILSLDATEIERLKADRIAY